MGVTVMELVELVQYSTVQYSPITDTNKHSECNFDPIPLNFEPKSLLSMHL